jgi:DNA-binding IclR family transcriptional regulator
VVVSLTQSATGVAFAAFMPPGQTQAAIDEELQARARSGQSDNGMFAQRIAEARQHGLARAVGTAASPRHKVTVNAFSAPVYGAGGHMVLAISTTCEAERLAPDWDGAVPQALREIARELSQRLGHRSGESLAAN